MSGLIVGHILTTRFIKGVFNTDKSLVQTNK